MQTHLCYCGGGEPQSLRTIHIDLVMGLYNALAHCLMKVPVRALLKVAKVRAVWISDQMFQKVRAIAEKVLYIFLVSPRGHSLSWDLRHAKLFCNFLMGRHHWR